MADDTECRLPDDFVVSAASRPDAKLAGRSHLMRAQLGFFVPGEPGTPKIQRDPGKQGVTTERWDT